MGTSGITQHLHKLRAHQVDIHLVSFPLLPLLLSFAFFLLSSPLHPPPPPSPHAQQRGDWHSVFRLWRMSTVAEEGAHRQDYHQRRRQRRTAKDWRRDTAGMKRWISDEGVTRGNYSKKGRIKEVVTHLMNLRTLELCPAEWERTKSTSKRKETTDHLQGESNSCSNANI